MTFLSCAYKHGCHLVLAADKATAQVTVYRLKPGSRAPTVLEQRTFLSRARARYFVNTYRGTR